MLVSEGLGVLLDPEIDTTYTVSLARASQVFRLTDPYMRTFLHSLCVVSACISILVCPPASASAAAALCASVIPSRHTTTPVCAMDTSLICKRYRSTRTLLLAIREYTIRIPLRLGGRHKLAHRLSRGCSYLDRRGAWGWHCHFGTRG